ncbi:ABC transporter ATP-binding protein [Nocardiopsis sp. NPDC101807]|uniref:ABC transporter ATP-binding protein n=1 Tax=Nocardiopsis sp. NPDC101807 TaxID=3364339 RepID=UPI00380F1002
MASVGFEKATHFYPGSEAPAVDELSLEVEDGEFLVLVGPSGCGKSTSLRMLAGLEEVDSGTIRIGGEDVTDSGPLERDIAMVFQSYALYPHMSVAQNMGFALEMAKVARPERERRVLEAARLLDLEPLLHRRPKALSGGQRQRVAMGRAIVREPRVFLMDEPLSNLDAQLRVSTRTQIAALQKRLGVTTVYVTHDQVEAMTMGDRVAVLKDGVLQQCDSPVRLYECPANAFVAGFIGSPAMNLREFPLVREGVRVGDADLPLTPGQRRGLAAEGASSALLGFRPEAVDLVGEGEGFAMEVLLVEHLGADCYLYGGLPGHPADGDLVVRVAPHAAPAAGATVRLGVRPGRVHVFSPGTGERLDG